jgi:hypothetical protein
MKRLVLVVVLAVLASIAWPEELPTDSQMRIFAGVKTSNSWSAAAMSLEVISVIFGSADINPPYWETGDIPIYYMVFTGAFGIGTLAHMISLTFTAIGCTRLDNAIIRDGTAAPRPIIPKLWSLISIGSMGLGLLAIFLPYPLGAVVPILFLTSIISEGVAISSTNAYAREIGWGEYKQAHKTAFAGPQNTILLSGHGSSIGGMHETRIEMPLLSIRY